MNHTEFKKKVELIKNEVSGNGRAISEMAGVTLDQYRNAFNGRVKNPMVLQKISDALDIWISAKIETLKGLSTPVNG